MEQIELRDSGLTVSRVGLGCNNFGGRIGFDETRAVVDAALDVGVTFFDPIAEMLGFRGLARAPSRLNAGDAARGDSRDVG